MSRGNVLVRAVATAVAAGLALTGCTGPGSGQPEEPGDSPAATTAPTVPPDPTAIDTLPDGDLVVKEMVPGRLPGKLSDALGQGRAVPTEDLFLVATTGYHLVALDRDTMQLAWRTRLRSGGDRKTEICPLTQPPPGATAVVVFSGFGCRFIDTYSLEDGRHTASRPAGGSTFDSNGPVTIAGRTFWSTKDAIFRVEPDGTSVAVASRQNMGFGELRLPLGEGELVSGVTGIAGSDVMVVYVARSFEDDAVGTFLGFAVGEDGSLTQAWRSRVGRSLGGRSVGGDMVFHPDMDGVVVDVVRNQGIRAPRMSMLDSADGSTAGRGFVLPQDPPGGYPEWIDFDYGDLDTKVDPDGQVVSNAGPGGFTYSPQVVRYDLAANDITWVWRPRFPGVGPTGGQPLGRSSDGEHYYVLSANDVDAFLVELDYETGRELRRWRVPRRVSTALDGARGVLAGNQLVLFEIYTTEFTRTVAATLQVE